MKTKKLLSIFAAFGLFIFHATATVRYVDMNCLTPTAPYTSWATAATNIQSAINVSSTSDLVLVTNGVYQTGAYSLSGSNRVAVIYPITVQSVNGPSFTTIQGYQIPSTVNGASAIRCVYLANGATLSGFTLTNGATITSENGGGVRCLSVNALITNCVMAGNAAIVGGAGAYYGTLKNCTLIGNSASIGGGAENSTLVNCILTGNSAGYEGGGAAFSSLSNCLLYRNSATANYGGGAGDSTLVNCTLINNSAYLGGGSYNGNLKNCIIYYNQSTSLGSSNFSAGVFNNCCTTPSPVSGANNVTSEPSFVDLAGGNFQLQPYSPCINAGTNSFVTAANDLADNPRIAGLTVDIGAYEFQYQSTGTFYVSINNPQPVFPFQTWDTAATNIQNAVDVASAGATVLVSNGVYRTGGRPASTPTTNRLCVTRSMTIQSVNGAAATSIEGYQIPGTTNGTSAIRCAYLTNGVVLDGFTLTNGATQTTGGSTYGGGILCESTNVLVRNCVVTKNSAGVYSGTLTNCTITGNRGGVQNGSLYHCTIAKNSGQGAVSCYLNNCLISSNSAVTAAGGGASACTLDNCILIGNTNSPTGYYGGGASQSTLNNCLLAGNSTFDYGGGAASCTLLNCTIVGNYAGQRGGGTYNCYQYNCINYSNTAAFQGTNYNNYYNNGNVVNTFSRPAGSGIVTNVPQFVDFSGGDFHLQSTSPCINAGNNVYVSGTTDLDGNPRIVGYGVDAGAYEKSPASILPNDWLQQYGFPNDGSLDFVDSDGTGMNNWQKWIAGLNPTNPASVLAMSSPAGVFNGVTVTWQSVNTRTYYLQRASDLTQPFSSIQSNLVGQAGITSFTDTSATNNGSYFYRIGVQ